MYSWVKQRPAFIDDLAASVFHQTYPPGGPQEVEASKAEVARRLLAEDAAVAAPRS